MRVLLVVLGLTAVAEADSKIARDAAAWCDAHEGSSFTVDKSGAWIPGDDPKARYTPVWKGKLDRDRRQDVILNQGDCGTRECIHAVYVQCSDGTYSQVFHSYASRLRLKRGTKHGWARLEIEHVGDLEPDGTRGREWSPLDFGPGGY